MADYTAIRGTGWVINDFSYSVSESGAFWYLVTDPNNPSPGNVSLAQDAMFQWQSVADITFTPYEDIITGTDIRFMEADMPTGSYGVTYGFVLEQPVFEAEIYINNDPSQLSGGFKAFTYLHELGHALGLVHPFATAIDPEGDPFATGYNHSNTIMAYSTWGSQYPTTPMLLDIQAIQDIYGANFSFNSGSTTYALTANSGLSTIWDGGGDDTIDASQIEASIGININLGEGPEPSGFPRAIYVDGVKNITYLAYGANIENAIGNDGNNEIIGNDPYAAGHYAHLPMLSFHGNNHLQGLGGNDQIFGLGGNDILDGGADNDRLEGGAGNDTYVFSGAYDHDTIDDSDGVGSIQIDGVTISGQATLDTATGHWVLDDHPTFYLTASGGDMVLHKQGDSSTQITITNFTPGETLYAMPANDNARKFTVKHAACA